MCYSLLLLMLPICVLTLAPDFDNLLCIAPKKHLAENTHLHTTSSPHTCLLQKSSPAKDAATEHHETPWRNNKMWMFWCQSLSPVDVVIWLSSMSSQSKDAWISCVSPLSLCWLLTPCNSHKQCRFTPNRFILWCVFYFQNLMDPKPDETG